MNNILAVFSQLQSVMQNPMPILARMGLPTTALQNPQQAVQELLNSGKMTQAQLNSLQQTAKQLQNLPQFQHLFTKNR